MAPPPISPPEPGHSSTNLLIWILIFFQFLPVFLALLLIGEVLSRFRIFYLPVLGDRGLGAIIIGTMDIVMFVSALIANQAEPRDPQAPYSDFATVSIGHGALMALFMMVMVAVPLRILRGLRGVVNYVRSWGRSEGIVVEVNQKIVRMETMGGGGQLEKGNAGD